MPFIKTLAALRVFAAGFGEAFRMPRTPTGSPWNGSRISTWPTRRIGSAAHDRTRTVTVRPDGAVRSRFSGRRLCGRKG